MKLLIHFQTLTVEPMILVNAKVISSQILQGIEFLTYAGVKETMLIKGIVGSANGTCVYITIMGITRNSNVV